MKKALIMLSIVLTLLLASFASATLTVSDITFGTKSTQRNNPLGENDNDQIGDTFSTTITVTNNDTAVSSPDLVFSGDIKTKFNLTYTLPTTWANGTNTVTVRGQIPEDWNTLIDDDTERSILAGTFTATGTSVTSASKNVYAWAESGLTMDNIQVIIDGVSYDYDDDEVTEIIPGADVSIKFEVSNEFNKNSNIEINDIDISVDSDNSDFEVDNDNDNIDLREDATKTFSTDISIDWNDVEDGDDTTISIEVIGQDDNGATHTITLDFNMEVSYPQSDINLNAIRVNPIAACAGDSVAVSFSIENIGEDDQTNLRARVEQTTLNWAKNFDTFRLDGRSDADTESENLAVSFTVPTTTRAGDYPVRVTGYYENDNGKDSYKYELINFTVLDCAARPVTPVTPVVTNNATGSNGMVITNVPTNNGATNTGATGQTVTATSKPKMDDNMFIIGLAVLVILLLIVVISLLTVVRKN